MAAQQRVWAELALHAGVLATFRALGVGERSQRRDIHGASTNMATGDIFHTWRHAGAYLLSLPPANLKLAVGNFPEKLRVWRSKSTP
jgi:hypothetical protein